VNNSEGRVRDDYMWWTLIASEEGQAVLAYDETIGAHNPQEFIVRACY